MDKRYRKIRKTDKLPELPLGFIPLYYLKKEFIKKEGRVLIWAVDDKKRYTIEWDGVSEYPGIIHFTNIETQ